MVKLTQKTATVDGSKIAYVDARIVADGHDYKVTFPDKTKRRANAFFKQLGFVIGKVDDLASVPEKVVEI